MAYGVVDLSKFLGEHCFNFMTFNLEVDLKMNPNLDLVFQYDFWSERPKLQHEGETLISCMKKKVYLDD